MRAIFSSSIRAGRVPIVVVALVVAGVFGATPITALAGKCAEGAPETPAAKIVNTAFAKDLEDCEVTTTLAFQAMAPGGDAMLKLAPKKYVKDRVVFSAGPDIGGQGTLFVTVEKDKSDVLFTLKAGDKLKIKGTVFMVAGLMALAAESVEKAQ